MVSIYYHPSAKQFSRYTLKTVKLNNIKSQKSTGHRPVPIFSSVQFYVGGGGGGREPPVLPCINENPIHFVYIDLNLV